MRPIISETRLESVEGEEGENATADTNVKTSRCARMKYGCGLRGFRGHARVRVSSREDERQMREKLCIRNDFTIIGAP